MAVVLLEGFDHLAAGQFTTKGWSANPASVVTGSSTRLNYGQAAVTSLMTKTLPSTYATLIAGVAINPGGSSFAANEQFLRFLTGAGAVVGACRFNAAGKLEVINSGATIIATGTTTFVNGTWYYLEFKLFVNGASGTCEVHLNAATEIAQTTGNFGSTNIGQVQLESANAPANHTFDDLYAFDTTTSFNNTFNGDTQVRTLYPSADGNYTQFSTHPAGSHFANVDETTPDGDTSYNADASNGDIDSYLTAGVLAGASVSAIQINLYARKDDAGTRQAATFVRQSAVDYAGTSQALGTTYSTLTQIYNTDPTGAAWTAATVNANEYGIEVTA